MFRKLNCKGNSLQKQINSETVSNVTIKLKNNPNTYKQFLALVNKHSKSSFYYFLLDVDSVKQAFVMKNFI